ncbi:DNA-directed RNA polymase III large subunit, putative [Bodo saltans]|uniref:DNA-directed RNA polymerase subunit n=1 Tax=Bodo saltans TaxID=75058 RepID=A0A0S4KJJ8_BODSA|nr:DNA-directed RNA polymase III large subunit, putative [Bodo saltans]|eukprot:CUI14455.1 DNA-directed RNA polymase III large subunit, putative [Bodo saltans]
MNQNVTFVDTQTLLPHKISEIHYGVLSGDDVHRLSVMPCRRVMGLKDFGVNDRRLGVCDRTGLCATCGLKSIDCVGHSGHVDLALPVFHLGYFTTVLRICRTICKQCSRVLLTDEEIAYHKRRFLSPKLEALQRAALAKAVQEDAYKTSQCPHCGAVNGAVRKARPLRIVHEAHVTTRKVVQVSEDIRNAQLAYAAACNREVEVFKENAYDFLDPVRIRALFLAILPQEICILGLAPGVYPDDLLVQSMLIPPVCVRPSGPSNTGSGTREDDLTLQYNDVIGTSDMLADGSLDPVKHAETWDLLQVRAARLLDSALPGFPPHMRTGEGKSFAQRLKGKHGRFRGNLSGKRVDFSGRSVISPDPNLAVDELAIPLRVAKVLTYPQRVFAHNIDLMRRLVRNGPTCHPGAVTVTFTKEGSRKGLHHDREAIAAKLSIGDIVERHVMNGDLMLFNRQPSLHRISMMCHKARVLPHRTLRFNECCCAPYNADFDGDEMNIHLVQNEEARAEALTLMLTAKNIITAKNGEPIIACTQDFLTASYLVTSRDVFFDRAQFCQCVSHWLKSDMFDLPLPVIWKPVELWTGKQIYDVIICPRRGGGPSNATVSGDPVLSLEATTKFYTGKGRHACKDEGYVAFMNSRLIAGRLDKKLLGGGAKDGLFARLFASSGSEHAAVCMNRIACFTSRWLMNYGFSLGLGDVFPTPSLEQKKSGVLEASFSVCADLIYQAQSGRLDPIPGMTVKQSLEARLNGELSTVRDTCGNEAVRVLTATNAPLIMALSGSKGSTLNIAQMMACVGQQTVAGKRIQNAFIDRSLPHFPRFAEHPAARGFVANSFFSSLVPTEFFFHTMAGREGLVDTAVKTAETGYIYRRLMKAMEDLSVQYDNTVRNSKGDIIQMRFGEDMLDPMLMEGPNGTPLNLPAEWLCVVNTVSAGPKETSLSPEEVGRFVEKQLESRQFRGVISARFQEDLKKFIASKVQDQRKTREALGLGKENEDVSSALESWQSEVLPLTVRVLDAFLAHCARKYKRKICEPGTPCGAIAAQSVGEPSTQMTLRTFHFAGVASMSITQGVPRLVEIINANRSISTPIIYAPLTKSDSHLFALDVKAQIERVLLKEITLEMVEVVVPGQVYIQIRLNRRLMQDLQLTLDAVGVRQQILAFAAKPMSALKNLKDRHIYVRNKDTLEVMPYETDRQKILFNIQQLLVILPDIVVCGIAGIKRAVIAKKQLPKSSGVTCEIIAEGAELRKSSVASQASNVRVIAKKLLPKSSGVTCEIIAEGAELRKIMNLAGVEGRRTSCNHIAVIEQVLGIEAARATIVAEIQSIMKAYSLSIDIRHVYLLADVMTHRGVVLGITRYGIQKMNNGVLTMASFERTTEHLYNAALLQRRDAKLSVSENIIVGNPVPLGTNAFTLLQARAAGGGSGAVKAPSMTTKRRFRPLASDGAFHLDFLAQ